MSGVLAGLIAAFPTPITGSFESIATATGTGSSNTITFSSIPGTYQHLQIRWIGKSSTVSASFYTMRLRFNGDTATNYATHYLKGDGTTASASGAASNTQITSFDGVISGSDASYANMLGGGVIDIHDYTSTTKNKTMRALSGLDTNTAGAVVLSSGLWFKTPEAINSISLITASGNWTTSSTFALYGIRGA
jgi:hypothetical protein